MAVMIVGTLEMIYTSGTDIVSEPLAVDMPSPTSIPLDFTSGLVFTEPTIDIRDTLEPYLADTYGLTSITRVVTPRAGALYEWTADKGGIARTIVLWIASPLKQVGAEWGITKTKPGRGVQNLTTTISSAGDIDFAVTVDPLGNVPGSRVTGLLPNTAYYVKVDVFISMSTTSTGRFRPVVKWPTGGTESLSGFTPPLTTDITVFPWAWTGQVTSDASGQISAQPSARWVSGSITSSRAEIIVRVDPI